jgi:TonB family protein
MLLWIHRNLPILLAAVLSVLLHAVVLFPAMQILGLGGGRNDATAISSGKSLAGLSGVTRDDERERRREERERELKRKLAVRRIQRAETIRKEPEPKTEEKRRREAELRDEKVELGIDNSDAVTMNWIGYAEYEKHLAALAEVEQAALRLESSSGAGGTASPSLPPAPPSPSVAMSPNPSPLPLPASAGGTDQPTETTLLAPASANPASPTAGSAQTDASEAPGQDKERARPAQPPEREAPDPAAKPDESSRNEAPPREQPDTTVPPAPQGKSADDPSAPVPSDRPASEGSETPKPTDDRRLDPTATISARPPETLDPSNADPTRRLDPAETGASENAPPRENADPLLDSIKPPLEAPQSDRDPSSAENLVEVSGKGDSNAQDLPPILLAPASGGVKGPEVASGQSNQPAPPSPAGSPGDARSDPGALSNRESDPSSIIDVPMSNWQNGKPLARRGITLQTFKPRFNVLQIIDGISMNPIVELVVGRDGVPQHVVVARSSGNPGVNEAIRSALFKWRASGKQIDQLKPGQTVTIRLKLIMLQD